MSSGVHFERTATVGSTVPQQSKEFSGTDVSILFVAMFLNHAAHIQSVGLLSTSLPDAAHSSFATTESCVKPKRLLSFRIS